MNNGITKILVLGIGQSNFLNQLYGGVLKETDCFQFSIDGYFDISKGAREETKLPYQQYFDFKNIQFSRWERFKAFIKFAATPFFYGVILFEISQKSSLNVIWNLLVDLAIAKHTVTKYIVPLNFSIYHFHFCAPHNLMMAYFLPKKAKMICSFWGSDLMRLTGVSNVYYITKAIKKASKITVQTPEMAEMLYCKYGREFMDRTTALRFTIDEEIFDEIDILKELQETSSDFKDKYKIPKDKAIIAVGHNAFRENNHLKMMEVLETLPNSLLDSCVFLLHLSYGGNPDYINKLTEEAEGKKRMSFCIIHDFLGPREIALLRLSTDILIQMPVSDALSGAMTEVLYAGNSVIAASWLPYGFFRRKGIYFYEVETFKELPALLTTLLGEKGLIKDKNQNNRAAIRSSFFPDTTTAEWIRLFTMVEKSR